MTRCPFSLSRLVKRIYEVDPLCCPECGGEMKVVAFIIDTFLASF